MTRIEELFALDGRVALVTGGSSGIGRAMAGHLAAAGAAVVLVALPAEKAQLEAAKAEIEAAGGRAAHVCCDVSRLEDLPQTAKQAAAFFISRIEAELPHTGDMHYFAIAENLRALKKIDRNKAAALVRRIRKDYKRRRNLVKMLEGI